MNRRLASVALLVGATCAHSTASSPSALAEGATVTVRRLADALVANDIGALVRLMHPRLVEAYHRDGETPEGALQTLFEVWRSRQMRLERVDIGVPQFFVSTTGVLFLSPMVRHFSTFEGSADEPVQVLTVTADGGQNWSVIYLDCLSDSHVRALAPDYPGASRDRLSTEYWRSS